MNINQTYYSDHFAIYTNIEALCCIPETDIKLYVNYISIIIIVNIPTSTPRSISPCAFLLLSSCPSLFLQTLSLGNQGSASSTVYQFAFPRISLHKWNHTLNTSLRLSSFTQHTYYDVHLCHVMYRQFIPFHCQELSTVWIHQSSSIHPLVKSWIIFNLWLLQIKLL